jgi:hypothetical protein
MDLDMFEKAETIRVINYLKDNLFLIISNCVFNPKKKEELYEILNKLQANVDIGKMEREKETLIMIKKTTSIIDAKLSFL